MLCPESRVLRAPPIGSLFVQGSMRNWRGYDLASIHCIPPARPAHLAVRYEWVSLGDAPHALAV